MKRRETILIPLPPDWKPEAIARRIQTTAEEFWNRGWVYAGSETDALMESVTLWFEKEITAQDLDTA